MGINCSSATTKHHKHGRTQSFKSVVNRENDYLEQNINNYIFYNRFLCQSLRLVVDTSYCCEKFNEYAKNREKLLTVIKKEFKSDEYVQIKISLPITQLNKESSDKVQILKIFHHISENDKNFFNTILSKGPPNEFRWLIYLTKAFFSNYTFIYHNIYSNLLNTDISEDLELQIRKDLQRSCLEVDDFNNETNLEVLFNVLKVHANVDKELSYCPGMNTLAACLLVLSDCNELEVFNIMQFLFSANYNNNIRDFYLSGFPKLQLFSYFIRKLMKKHLKTIYVKCKELNVPDEIWIYRWIQSLYLLVLPFSVVVRIWDCIFAFGIEFLLNFTIAFIGYFEKKIIKTKDMGDFLDCFKVKFKDDDDLVHFRELLINNALKLKLDNSFLLNEKKKYDKNEGEKDKVNIYTISKSMIPSLAMAPTNDANPKNVFVKSRNITNPIDKKIIQEVIYENYDFEVENDLEKIKIQWEMNSDNLDVKVRKDLDKSV